MVKDFSQFQIKNRKAEYEYFFVDKYQAGIVLSGSEVKAIREGHASIKEAYCILRDGELWIKNMHISEYKQAAQFNHEPVRERKLLLKKSELKKLERKIKEKGFTLIPYRIFFSDTGYVKVEIVLGKGKRSFDKRESIKAKDQMRDLDRIKKQYR